MIPSPSQLARVDACLASELLPHSDVRTAAAERGTVIHAFLAAATEHGRDAALAEVPEDHREFCSIIDLERLPAGNPGSYAVELALAYNVRTGVARVLGQGLTREQARAMCSVDEMPAILDIAGLATDAAIVLDVKTGHSEVPGAEVNWQVQTYALMLAAVPEYRRERATVGIVRIFENGVPWFDLATLDELDLDAAAARLRGLLRRLEEAREAYRTSGTLPRTVEGAHCRYCPALAYCPAKVASVHSLIQWDGQGTPTIVAESLHLTPEQAGTMWTRLQGAKALLKRIEENIEGLARQTPLPLPGGMVLTEVEDSRESIVADKALPLLEAKYGQAFVEEARETKVTITKKALTDALRKLVLPGMPKKEAKITAVEKALLEKLRAAGAVATKTFKRVEPVKPDALPAGDGA